ncbi:MAG TPA: hypothetical protein VJ777_21195 [Mycobacterium sp.]|nr:hypothetical protein [Mycobacterium sp.]
MSCAEIECLIASRTKQAPVLDADAEGAQVVLRSAPFVAGITALTQ